MIRITRFYLYVLVVLALVLAGCGGGGAASGDEAGEEGGELSREGMIMITEEHVESGIELEVGQQAVLMLEAGYDWAVNATPDLVFSKVKDAELQEGEQAIFDAKFAGSATIQAIGKPQCLAEDPPCKDPQKQYLIKVKVLPSSQ